MWHTLCMYRTIPHKRALTAALIAATLTMTGCAAQEASESAAPRDEFVPASCDAAAQAQAEGEATEGQGRDISSTPEIGTGYRSGMKPVKAERFAVATANPLATKAACDILAAGGTAADAVVAAQAVLGLVEPQSSGLGGGGYIVYYDAKKKQKYAIDGREVAPLAADENYLQWVSAEDKTEPLPDARRSGRSIGVPGIVAALEELHKRSGSKPWAEVLAPGVKLAQDGFEISPRMAASIADSEKDLAKSPAAAAYFLDGGKAKTAGTLLQNPEYAQTLRAISEGGADAFYTGEIAQAIVEEATRADAALTPSLLTTADLAGYDVKVRDVLCGDYRDLEVCGMPPSSSGGVAVLETLGILNQANLAQLAPAEVGDDGALPAVEAVHLISEAERLAYADRDAYIGDSEFVDVPGGVEALLKPDYLRERFAKISLDKSMGKAEPGELRAGVGVGADVPEKGTTHISVIDSYGNAASVTSSVEAAFGSFHFVKGFVLNNQLTDFNAEPVGEDGRLVANRVEAAKRPRSSMSPLLVFDKASGELKMVVGSPGGSTIIQYVVKTLVGIEDWGMNPQQAVSSPNFGARNKPVTGIGGEHPLVADSAALQDGLRELGHEVDTDAQTSGLSALVVEEGGIVGGADPRREGVVLGG